MPPQSFTTCVGTSARSKLGPEPLLFYQAVRARPTPEALAQLLVDLVQAQQDVPAVLKSQRRGLLVVAGLFAATVIYSVVLLV